MTTRKQKVGYGRHTATALRMLKTMLKNIGGLYISICFAANSPKNVASI